MKCEQCGKNESSVHFTKIENGQKTVFNLCQACAQAYSEFVPGIDFQNMLASMFDQPKIWGSPTKTAERCPTCQRSLNDIRRQGQLGCSDCYDTFGKEMHSLLRRIHGTTKHVGKIPSTGHARTRVERQVESLRLKLAECVKQEDYEQAAKYRDEIKTLENTLRTREGE